MKVVLSNSYGTPNVGDQAILTAMVDWLTRRHHHVSILTYDPKMTAEQFPSAQAIHSGIIGGNLATCRAIRKSDLLVIGGGGILQDATSLGNLLFHASRAVIAKWFGTPHLICGVGVGPLRRVLSKHVTKRICSQAQGLFVRDESSIGILKRIGVSSASIDQGADLALLLDRLPEDQMDDTSREILQNLESLKRKRPLLVGLSLRPPVGNRKTRSKMSPELMAHLKEHGRSCR